MHIVQVKIILLALLLGVSSVHAATADKKSKTTDVSTSQDKETTYIAVKANFPVPQVDARAWAIFEFNSGRLVAGSKAFDQFPPASITKLMSNYVVFEALQRGDISLQDQVSISEKAWRTEGSRMFAEVGSKIELQHLLKSTIIQSGNDAAVALADHVAGSELQFAQIMNKTAADLGLGQSHFMNATGLPDPNHYMSASDIAILSAAIIRDYPQFYGWYSEKQYEHNEIVQYNRNKLLWKDESIDGLKTGHTEAAGFCLVGSALRGGERWIAVVLGSSDERKREQAVQSLLDFAFAAYEPIQMLGQQGGLATAQVYLGEADEVLLQVQKPVNLVVPAGREKDVVTELQYSPYFRAPIEIGQPMGVATLTLDNKQLADVPLVSMSSIKKGSIWKRFKDDISLRWREFREG